MSRRLLRAAACLAAALAAATPVSPASAAPEPGRDVGQLLTELQGLYQKAEEATEAYNATEAALAARQGEERRLTSELGAAHGALARHRAAAGRLARAQYQGSHDALPRYARMLLSGDPQALLEQRRVAAREAAHRAAVIQRLTRSAAQAGALAAKAREELRSQADLVARRKAQKEEVTGRLQQVERLLASLTTDELAALSARERAVTAGAQRDLLASGRLGTATRTPTAAGGAAVRYATAQIGKPYVWGAEGPGSFDCSGLTSQAWAAAGRTIPRTSQEQWAQLTRIPLNQLRPGDLVVYFPKATHVALYLGDGKVVQAPRPGARVKVSPIAANPLLGAVRPDPDGAPLAHYAPPELPPSADAGEGEGGTGDHTGYSAEEAPAPAPTSAR
ncbi:C40 family peptidase [Streptomyces antimicrobicus]|uniref:NlpC/P60 family protein n=1 Tax=Streptomyces antimicrobicus TaxID=2883108 RepID=A0ABS8BBW1_9ACTN|nr:C40 family peptidase [Streptomyces antimicrobicus]MCB5182019.1 NlpC/P60 family protein [Streptomyces antimicrobicus]